MMTQTQTNGRQEIEVLLPWHATGRLSRSDAERVEAALAADENLALRYRLVREELAETIHLIENLGAPSTRAMERVLATVAVEPAAGGARGRRGPGWLGRMLESVSTRTLAAVAAAACIVVIVEAGVIAAQHLNRGPGSYQTASVSRPGAQGRFALVGFAPDANAADVTRFLENHRMSIVDGPRAGGLYKLKFEANDLTVAERDQLVERMRRDSDIVRFAAPTE